MIKWLDLNLRGYGSPEESLKIFTKELDMNPSEADRLFKVWIQIEDHRNWYDEFSSKEEEDCTNQGGGSWSE